MTYTADGEGGRKGTNGGRESFAQSVMLCSSVRGREMRMLWPEKKNEGSMSAMQTNLHSLDFPEREILKRTSVCRSMSFVLMTDRWTGSCLMLGACCPSLLAGRKTDGQAREGTEFAGMMPSLLPSLHSCDLMIHRSHETMRASALRSASLLLIQGDSIASLDSNDAVFQSPKL